MVTIAQACGQHHRAARLFGVGEAAREQLGISLVPGLVPRYTQAMSATKAVLGERTFAGAHAEGRRLSPDTARAEAALVVDQPPPTGRNESAFVASRYGLTPRKRDVLRLLVQGNTDQEIADTLFLSRRTVTTHASNLFSKLGVSNRVEATALAVRKGLPWRVRWGYVTIRPGLTGKLRILITYVG